MTDIEIARDRLRQAAIRAALYAAWPRPLGAGLISESLPADLSASASELGRTLYYLCDRGDIQRHGQTSRLGPADRQPLYRLSVAGIDQHEADPQFGTARARAVRLLRLRVLQALEIDRAHPMSTALVSVALASDHDLDLSIPSLRCALTYLVERDLVRQDGEDAYSLSAAGIDYLAGDGDGCPGIARPMGW